MTLDPLSRFRLDGKVAVVTGASSGLGVRFAQVLDAVGARVVLSARRAERLADVAATLTNPIIVPGDMSVSADRERLIATALSVGGRIDVLVNNAGIGHTVSVEDETEDEFRYAMEVNVTALWHLSKLAGVPMVAQRSGSIVNIASILGQVASAPIKQAHYTASKGAVINLTRELAVQWARKGVRVNSLAPGWFPSEMTAGMESDPGSQAFMNANLPMKRMGEHEELDGALLLLATDAGSYMTGTSVIVDGGWVAR
jgi:NAD(P)-dependent dehydrogenase (short-subunit alcohol dehydrogenase family)